MPLRKINKKPAPLSIANGTPGKQVHSWIFGGQLENI
jgi:hypothetical protein